MRQLIRVSATVAMAALVVNAAAAQSPTRTRAGQGKAAARQAALTNSTVGGRRSIVPPAAAPGFVDPSITIEQDLALGAASNIFKAGSLLLWDDGFGGDLGVGRYALAGNTTGVNNTAVGFDSLYYNGTGARNTAVGRRSLYYNVSGNGNTAVGHNALYYGTDKSFNTAIGSNALGGYSGAPGSDNTALGWAAGYHVSGGVYNIHIGSTVYGLATDTFTTRIGNYQTQVYLAGVYGSAVTSGHPVYVDVGGKLGLFTSSQRFKADVEDLGAASEAILDLRPVSFRLAADEAAADEESWGLIAEEVASVLPQMVVYGTDGSPKSVRYNLLSTLLLNELQKQHALLDEQAAELESLRRRLARLEGAAP